MHGIEWVVEAWGCSAEALRTKSVLQGLFASLVDDLQLRPVGQTVWHQFPGNGGITGLCLLSESHLTCHTFPEHESLCLNLFCCVPRAEWDFQQQLQKRLDARDVLVRKLVRSYDASRDTVASG
jgi:S-adenosylmethionine decarboxylase